MNKTMLLAGMVVIAAGSAQAATITHNGSKAISTTSWTENFNIPQFDDMGGNRVLDSVKLTLSGEVVGDANVESLNQGPSNVTVNLQATITMSLMGDDLGVVIPVANESFMAGTFDGSIDFGGSSGAMFADLMGSDMTMNTLVNGMDDLSAFIGLGTVPLVATAVGTSNGSGAGNLILQFFTDAGLDFSVVYEYHAVPTPGAAGLLAFAGAAGSIRRRRGR
ncbi:MAG: choice-of-anchor E domain-containing protein [Phycisphaeraceae bacterium]|nr:choice-of-anchor E domain-containing protein [Phycisphaeraceae bacterium]MCB9848295.1 choice-of-anchor E domain-containing protein [Phycisphaeraceae bacterium]